MNGVLIDGGSALNICPYSTLEKMKINPKRLRASHLVVRAFDGSRKDTMGEIELPVEIRPYTFDISFQVLDIAASYNMLLGRPWIHMAGAVPSTLHQQIKFIINGNLITVAAEPHCPPHSVQGMPVINLDESIEPISYQAFEVSTPHYQPLGAPALKPKVSSELTFAAREMMTMNFQPGQGLGKNGQGIKSPIQLPTQFSRAGLGYHGSMKQKGPHKKIPVKLAGILIPKVNKEASPKTVEPVVETERKILTPPSEKLAKQEEFLQEIVQQFESKCYLSGKSAGKEMQNEDGPSRQSQPIMPFINWAERTIPKEAVDENQGQVAVIIEEVHNENSPSISHVPAELTIANCTMEPVVSKRE